MINHQQKLKPNVKYCSKWKHNEKYYVIQRLIWFLIMLKKPKNLQLQSFINLKIDGCHTSCIFISVIGMQFAATRVNDLCIEATLIGISWVEIMIRGSQYNWSLKIVHEELQRLMIEAFERWLKEKQKNDVFVNNFLWTASLKWFKYY